MVVERLKRCHKQARWSRCDERMGSLGEKLLARLGAHNRLLADLARRVYKTTPSLPFLHTLYYHLWQPALQRQYSRGSRTLMAASVITLFPLEGLLHPLLGVKKTERSERVLFCPLTISLILKY